jgi:hypothetical protein
MPTYTRSATSSAFVRNSSGDEVQVNTGESVSTFKILGTGWTKTSDEPYFPLGKSSTPITSPDTAEGLKGFRTLKLLTAGIDIVVKANVAANPYSLSLTKDVETVIDNSDGFIDALVITGTGTVSVVGIP